MQNKAIHPIRAARHKAGLTQAALAATIGVTKATISAWEGAYYRPEPDAALRLCQALPGLTLDAIYSVRPTRRRM